MNRLIALDGLRGIFALMIVILHSPVNHHLLNTPLVRNSFVAVEFFFVLSGFVITASYGNRLRSIRDIAHFAFLRLARLWPLHAFIIGLFLLFFLAQHIVMGSGPFSESRDIWPWTIRDILFLNAFENHKEWFLNFPSWSINAEFWAYLAFGLVATRMIFAPAIMLTCWLIIIGIFDPGFGATWDWSLFRAIFYFFVGSLTFKLWIRVKLGSGWLEALAAVGCVMLIVYYDDLPRLVSPVVFCFTILVFANPTGMIGRILTTRFFEMLGQRSYAIYMSHVLIIMVIGTVVKKVSPSAFQPVPIAGEPANILNIGGQWPMDAWLIAELALVVWVAGLLYRWIELPGMRAAKRISARVSGATAKAA